MKMHRAIFLTLIFLAVIGLIGAWIFFRQPVTIHARVAEDGGFMPMNIKAQAGVPLKLRLVADDVEHTFAIGQNSMNPVVLKPGEPTDITLTFDYPGVYVFYTTTPSSMNFWRMRGTIEVLGAGEMQAAEPPLYVRLGLDLDAQHQEEGEHFELPRQPSAARGAALAAQIPSQYLTRDYYVAHAPSEAFKELRAESTLRSLSGDEIWDVTAYSWRQNVSAGALNEGRRLYQTHCAACHGEDGAGNGQFADEMKAAAEKNKGENGIQAPTDFTDAEHLLEAKPAILQGLILRGGMGTGMPMWGTIFTDEQTWNLVAYLYSFQFDYQGISQ